MRRLLVSLILLNALSGHAQTRPLVDEHIDASSPSILFSPYNWKIARASARTINSGAYLRTIVSGTSKIWLDVNTTANVSPFPRLHCRIDGHSWSLINITEGSSRLLVAKNLESTDKHLVECVVSSTSEFLNRWADSQTAVEITGFTLDSGGTLTAPERKSKSILWFGDSITEGYKTISNATTPEGSDVLGSYAWSLTHLDAEVGIVGFGGQGITHTGQGGVPAFPNAFQLLYSDVPRSFDPPPDVIGINQGENDDTADIVGPYTAVVLELLKTAPKARILLMIPFSQREAGNVQAVERAVNNNRVSLVPTVGWFNPQDSSDGQHPYRKISNGILGPKLLPFVAAALDSAH